MKREPNEMQNLVRQYEQKMSEASVPLWMDAPDILDILDYYEQKNLYFESEQCMRLALRLHPDNPEVQIRRAYRLKNEGRWAEAVRVVEAMSDQNSLDVSFFWGEKALSELEFEKAEEFFEKGLKAERDYASEMRAEGQEFPTEVTPLILEMGELFMDYGSIAYAQKYLNKIPQEAPEYNRAQMLLAECLFQLGDTFKALQSLEKVLDEDPYNLEAWIMMADLSNEVKNYDKCSEAANFALAIDPKSEKALRFKAVAALGAENYDEVLEVYETYRHLYPSDYTMALSAGEILINKMKMSEAREVLSRSNQACPNDNPDKLRILTDIATTYAAEGKIGKIYETLLGCCSLGTSHADVLLQTAQICFNYRHREMGLKAVEHYLENYELTAETRLRIAQMLCENQVFISHTALWDKLFNVTEEGPTLAAVYLAFAARVLKRPAEYLRWLTYAVYTDPTQVRHIFGHVYANDEPMAILRQAREECKDLPF